MDVQRQISTTAIEIDPKSQSKNESKPQLSPKMSSTTTAATNEIVSPLKRKSSQPAEITSLICDAKRRRHHRRPNKKWRQKGMTSEPVDPVGQKAPGPLSTTTENCQKNRKICAKLSNSSNQTSWKRKRKQHFNNFFANQNQNSFKAIPKALSAGQHSQVGVGSQRLPGACGGSGKKRANVVLRPTKVPLLNAPRNSTQFIIDDHESSDLVSHYFFVTSFMDVP